MILDLPYNFHWIEPGEAARAAQAYLGFFGQFLDGHGIRSVVNLRGCNPQQAWWKYETRVCGARRIIHRDARLSSRQLPSKAMLRDIIDAFDAVPRPLLLKCSGGQDRTSLAAALYLLHRHGWKEHARAQWQFARWPYLHRPRGEQRWLHLLVRYAREDAGGRPLSQWLDADYSANRFRDWLEQNGEHGSYDGLYGVREQPNHV